MYDWKFRKWERKVEAYQEQIRRKKMKITVKPKPEPEQCEILFDDIPVGYVYIANDSDGPTVLKLRNNEAVLLINYDNDRWFKLAKGYKGLPAYKILGKLTEIIVEE